MFLRVRSERHRRSENSLSGGEIPDNLPAFVQAIIHFQLSIVSLANMVPCRPHRGAIECVVAPMASKQYFHAIQLTFFLI